MPDEEGEDKEEVVEAVGGNTPDQPDAGNGGGDREGKQRRGGDEILPAELAEREIGRDFEEVDRREEHHRGAREEARRKALRHHIDLKGRRAGMADEAGEARERAPEYPRRRLRLRRRRRAAARARDHEDDETDRDQSDREP